MNKDDKVDPREWRDVFALVLLAAREMAGTGTGLDRDERVNAAVALADALIRALGR